MRYDPRELTDEELVARSHEELYHVTRAYEELMRRYQRTCSTSVRVIWGTTVTRTMSVRK